MFDTNKLNKALRCHDFAQVAALLGDNGLADADVASKFVTAVRQSSCLVIQIENLASEQRRDQLVAKCRELLSKCHRNLVPKISDFFGLSMVAWNDLRL